MKIGPSSAKCLSYIKGRALDSQHVFIVVCNAHFSCVCRAKILSIPSFEKILSFVCYLCRELDGKHIIKVHEVGQEGVSMHTIPLTEHRVYVRMISEWNRCGGGHTKSSRVPIESFTTWLQQKRRETKEVIIETECVCASVNSG